MLDKIKLELTNLQFTTTPNRINEMKWEGAVTKIGQVSDGIPGGAMYPVIWERSAIEAAMDTLIGMPLNCRWPEEWFSNPAYAFTGHEERFVIGMVQKVWIDGDYLMCSGIIWKDNFPDVAFMITNAKESLGFSVECYGKNKTVQDEIEHVYEMEFTGLTMAWSNICAFEDTFITQLVACRKNKNKSEDDVDMTPEEMKAMLETFTQGITATIAEVKTGVEAKMTAMEGKIEAAKVAIVDPNAEELAKIQATVDALKAENEQLKAAKPAIPAPTAAQTAASKGDIDFDSERDKINKMTCSNEERMNERFKLSYKAAQ
jgi:hypothetical protein